MLDVITWYNPILETSAEAVTEFGPDTAAMGSQMIDVMRKYNGVGLAGNQVGALLRIFVMDRQSDEAKEKQESLIVCNPRIMIWKDTPDEPGQEGCLSFPGVYNQVLRGTKVDMLYQDPLYGKEHSIYLEGLEARIVQHEVDHLNGIMFFERLATKQMRKATIREYIKKHPDARVKA
jgi:peptide deformylase